MFASKDTLLTRPSGYTIARSVRLRSSASAYFNRTPASAGSSQKITYSAWVKRGALSAVQYLMASNQAGTADDNIRFESGDALSVNFNNGTNVYNIISTPVYRDPSAWYHVIVAIDTTQAAAANRVLIYVNGAQITSFGTASYPPQNYNMTGLNTTKAQNIGRYGAGSNYFDGYLTEINFIDGQALTPSSFGSTNALTGVWQPAKYTGTYGTNGFYLNFSDNSSNTATTIGKDYSGNGNNWTPNNISVTAGATYDSMTDVPTLTSATAANYCVLNPLDSAGGVISSGNLDATITGQYLKKATFGVSTGKWYWEVTQTSTGDLFTGIVTSATSPTSSQFVGQTTNQWGYYNANGNKYTGGTGTSYGATYTNGDVIGIALDCDGGTLTFYKNNSSQGTAYSSLSGTFTPAFSGGGASGANSSVNFGQRPFSYTPPTGFVALNTFNLPDSTIKNGAAYMAATTYTGNGSTQSIANTANGVSFKPDMTWIKSRSAVGNHVLVDSVRVSTNQLSPNQTSAELAASNGVTSFNSNGFSLGAGTIGWSSNDNGTTYVGWQWQAGAGTSSSNTNGSITSTVSVGATQGFSVVTYTGTGTSGQTVGHGLGVKPAFIIVKDRSSSGSGWVCWQQALTGGNEQDRYIYLNTTGASGVTTSYWGSGITSSVFGVWATGGDNNRSGSNFVAYCFAAVKGFSAFGSYTGNGSNDGPFVYLGFRPRFLLIKNTTTAGTDWEIWDSARDLYNVESNRLYPDSSAAENGGQNAYDFLSNGFKARQGGATDSNQSGATIIYAAFAENPFKNSLAR